LMLAVAVVGKIVYLLLRRYTLQLVDEKQM
jgi:hypothetical protein